MEKNRNNSTRNSKRRDNKSDESLNYYKRINSLLLTNNDKGQDKSNGNDGMNDDFLDNVFSQLSEEAMQVCKHPQISPIIERLVTKASASHIDALLKVFSKNWSIVCGHKCSSHVLQKLLMVLPKFIHKKLMTFDFESEEDDESVESSLIKTVLELVHFSGENLEDSMKDPHTSHIFRALLQVIGGTCVDEKVLKSRTSRNYAKHIKTKDTQDENSGTAVTFLDYEVPMVFHKKLKKFYKDIFKLEDFGVYLMDTNASPVIQTLLLVLHKVDLDLCQKVIHKVIKATRIKETAESVNLPPVAADNVGSFLVELIVSLSSKELTNELFKKLFKGKLLLYAKHSSANFVLQKLIRSCQDEEMMIEILEEVNACVKEILKSHNYGVFVAIAGAVEKLGSVQEKFVEMMMHGLHCEEEDKQEKLVPLIASFTLYEDFPQSDDAVLPKVNYHGSLLLQHMLRFSNTQCITTSLQSLEPAQLVNLSCDPCGSHVIDTAFKSDRVSGKMKDALLNKFEKYFIILACDRNGSRTLECIWKNVSLEQKTTIASSLCTFEDKVRSDRFGFHIHRNFALFHFKNRKKDWLSIQQSDQRKRKMFKDVLDKDKPAKKKKKLRQKKQKQSSE